VVNRILGLILLVWSIALGLTTEASAQQCVQTGGYPWLPESCLNASDLNKIVTLNAGITPPKNSNNQGALKGTLWLDQSSSPWALRFCKADPCFAAYNSSQWSVWGTVDPATGLISFISTPVNISVRLITSVLADSIQAADGIVIWKNPATVAKSSTLPLCTSSNRGETHVISDGQGNAATYNIQVSAGLGNTIRGSANYTLNQNNQSISVSCDGSSNWAITAAYGESIGGAIYSAGTGLDLVGNQFNLDDTAVTIGTYGSASQVSQFTVDQQGRLIGASNVPISIPASQLTNGFTGTADTPVVLRDFPTINTPTINTATINTATINTPTIGPGGATYTGATSGTQVIRPAATTTGTITWPSGTRDFSISGGANQVVQQTTAGGMFSVGQLSAANLSDGNTGTGAIAHAASPTFTGTITGGLFSTLGAGNRFGNASGDYTAPTRTNTNILFYDGGATNWAGIGTHTDGSVYIATGTSAPSTKLLVDTTGDIHAQVGGYSGPYGNSNFQLDNKGLILGYVNYQAPAGNPLQIYNLYSGAPLATAIGNQSITDYRPNAATSADGFIGGYNIIWFNSPVAFTGFPVANKGNAYILAQITATIATGGSLNQVNDVLTVVGGTCNNLLNTPPQFQVTTVSGGAVTGVAQLPGTGACGTYPGNPVTTTSSRGGVTPPTLNLTVASLPSVLNAAAVYGRIRNQSSGPITNAYAIYADGLQNTGQGGTVTNSYGVYVNPVYTTGASSLPTNDWGLFFGGNHTSGSIGAVSGSDVTVSTSGGGVVKINGNFTVDGSGGLKDTIDEGFVVSTSQLDKTSNVSLSTVPGLSIALTAGKTYTCRTWLSVTSGAAGGFNIGLVGSGGLTATLYRFNTQAWNGSTIAASGTATALNSSNINNAAIYTDIFIQGSIVVNAAGTLNVQAAQNTSNATTSSVFQGSSFYCKRVN
jgi:hypothetical protein